MKKRFYFFLLAFLICMASYGQTKVVEANQLKSVDSIKLKEKWIKSILTDTALSGATSRDVASAEAIKSYVLNRLAFAIKTGDTAAMLAGLLRADTVNKQPKGLYTNWLKADQLFLGQPFDGFPFYTPTVRIKAQNIAPENGSAYTQYNYAKIFTTTNAESAGAAVNTVVMVSNSNTGNWTPSIHANVAGQAVTVGAESGATGRFHRVVSYYSSPGNFYKLRLGEFDHYDATFETSDTAIKRAVGFRINDFPVSDSAKVALLFSGGDHNLAPDGKWFAFDSAKMDNMFGRSVFTTPSGNAARISNGNLVADYRGSVNVEDTLTANSTVVMSALTNTVLATNSTGKVVPASVVTPADTAAMLGGRVPYYGADKYINWLPNNTQVRAGIFGAGSATTPDTMLMTPAGFSRYQNGNFINLRFRNIADATNKTIVFQNKSYTVADSADVAARLRLSDTASMLSGYARTGNVIYTAGRGIKITGNSISVDSSALPPITYDNLTVSNTINAGAANITSISAITVSGTSITSSGVLTASGGINTSSIISTGGTRHGHVTKSTNYTVTSDDYYVTVNGTATITLHSAVGKAGQRHVIKAVPGATATINTTSGESIDSYASGSIQLIGSNHGVLIVFSDGTNWLIEYLNSGA